MQSGFLEKAIAKDAQTKPKKVDPPGRKEWDERTLDVMVKVLEEILDENTFLARNDLDRRVRSGTGAREFRGRCGHNPTGARPPGEEDDEAARLIREHTKPSSLRDKVAPVMDQAAEIFRRVKEKGKADGVTMDPETEVQVLRDVIKECLIRHCLKCINADNSGTYASGSHDAGLLATPQGYFGGDLNSFSGDAIRDLMERGYGIQDGFVDDSTINDVQRELELLDYDGKLVEVQQQKMTGYRTDRIYWLNYEALDREKQPGLMTLMKKMISIPFELNKKCSLYLQASSSFQVACYPNKAYYKKHVDGGYEDMNNGRKISAVYYVNPSWSSEDGGQLRMYKRRPNPFKVAKAKSQGVEIREDAPDEAVEDIDPLGGRVVLFRSRDMPHEVLPTRRKRFAISLWLMGPPGPGDQPDIHATPT